MREFSVISDLVKEISKHITKCQNSLFTFNYHVSNSRTVVYAFQA